MYDRENAEVSGFAGLDYHLMLILAFKHHDTNGQNKTHHATLI